MSPRLVLGAVLVSLAGAAMAVPTADAATPSAHTVPVVVGALAAPAPLPDPLAFALGYATGYAAAHPADLAHPWVNRAAGVLVVPAVTPAGRALAAARDYGVPATVSTATNSYAALERIKDRAIEITREDVAGANAIIGTYVDAERNRVVMETNAAPAALLALLATRYGADAVLVRLVPEERRPVRLSRNSDTSPFWGGAYINVPGGLFCSTGFPWIRNNNHRMITAGHCVPSGGSVSTPSQSMGSVTSASGENWTSGTGTVLLTGQSAYRGDLSRVDMAASRYAGTSIYNGGVNSSTSISIGSMFPRRNAAGDSYCTGGVSTGELCGWAVQTAGGNWTYSNGENAYNVSRGTKSLPCLIGGDSGGPVYQNGTTVSAMGIISGGGSDGVTCTGIFTDTWTAWDAFGGWVSMNVWTNDGDRRTSNQILQQAHRLVSPNGSYTLEMQGDGNLVLYKPGHVAVWSTGTPASANEGAYALMLPDGNFAMYKPGGVWIWSTHTSGNSGAYIRLQDDCNLVVYRTNGTAAWASNTQFC